MKATRLSKLFLATALVLLIALMLVAAASAATQAPADSGSHTAGNGQPGQSGLNIIASPGCEGGATPVEYRNVWIARCMGVR